MRPTSRFPAASKITSPCQSPTCINRFTPRSSRAMATSTRSKFEPRRWMRSPRRASPPIGATRKASTITRRKNSATLKKNCTGFAILSACLAKTKARKPRITWRPSRTIFSTRTSMFSPRSARSSISRPARRPSTSPTRFTPKSAIRRSGRS